MYAERPSSDREAFHRDFTVGIRAELTGRRRRVRFAGRTRRFRVSIDVTRADKENSRRNAQGTRGGQKMPGAFDIYGKDSLPIGIRAGGTGRQMNDMRGTAGSQQVTGRFGISDVQRDLFDVSDLVDTAAALRGRMRCGNDLSRP